MVSFDQNIFSNKKNKNFFLYRMNGDPNGLMLTGYLSFAIEDWIKQRQRDEKVEKNCRPSFLYDKTFAEHWFKLNTELLNDFKIFDIICNAGKCTYYSFYCPDMIF